MELENQIKGNIFKLPTDKKVVGGLMLSPSGKLCYITDIDNETGVVSGYFQADEFHPKAKFKDNGLENFTPIHLYVTDDTELNADMLCTDGKQIFRVNFNPSTGYEVMNNNVGYGDYDYHTLQNEYKKIIATNDPAFNMCDASIRSKNVDTVYTCSCPLQILPGLDQSFIEKYCEIGGVDEIFIETEIDTIESACTCDTYECPNSVFNGNDYDCTKRFPDGKYWHTTSKIKVDEKTNTINLSINNSYSWIPVTERLPETENYYAVRFENGIEDEKPFRIRPKKNILGFMTEENVTHWAVL